MTAYRFLTVLLVGLAAVLGATIDASNELFQDPGGNWPSGAAPVILDDCFVIKLSEQAAQEAEALPENGLPRGVEEFDALLLKRGLTTGRRVARSHGLPTLNLELFRSVGLDRAYVIDVPQPTTPLRVRELVREFSAQPWVEYAEPVYVSTPTSTIPNDQFFNLQWSHLNVGQNVNGTSGTPDADADTDLAWDTQTGSSSSVVAILDTGADLDHPDLIDNIVAGWDFIGNDPVPNDLVGHGTACAGIAAARGNNGIGAAGVCWTCGIMPLRVSTSTQDADAITFAADNGATVWNASHTYGAAWIQVVIDASEYAKGLGLLGFASATNANGYNIGTPAAYPAVVPVGGSNQFDQRIYAYSDVTDLTGPSPNTVSTGLSGGYLYFGGTSSSSPFAAGMGALLRSEDPNLNVNELRHLLRLGCDDQVGVFGEDTPGWDQYMGYGRVNMNNSLALVDGPWLALDRPHYVCAGDLTVALKDLTAGATAQVTVTGSIGGDSETVTVTPVGGSTGYYEGTIPFSWAGVDGPVVLGDGKLDVVHGENIDAGLGGLAATAYMECEKRICQSDLFGMDVYGDCDADGSLDPGEIWRLSVPVFPVQTEQMFGVTGTLTTTSPWVTILKDTATYGDVPPFVTAFPGETEAFRVQLLPGAPANTTVDFDVTYKGTGYISDQAACLSEQGLDTGFTLRANRDLGATVQTWDFDTGTTEGFLVSPAHGPGPPSGDLSECSGTWINGWSSVPVTDKAHSGTYSMRLGNGTDTPASIDGGLLSGPFTVPDGGGAISFYMWMDSFLYDPWRAWDGMVVEARRTGDAQWTYLDDGTYTSEQVQSVCQTGVTKVPFGYVERMELFAGDGSGTTLAGDEFDVQHQLDLSDFAGDEIQVRWRFGSHDFNDPSTHGQGTWIDTVAAHDAWTADTWPGTGPGNLASSTASCPSSLSLTWDAVANAGGYEVHRSEVSCADALASLTAYDTTVTPGYTDTGVVQDTNYFYAVGATATGSGCPTVRPCVSDVCSACAPPPDPTGLVMNRNGNDVEMTWFGSAPSGPTWNTYRDGAPDPSGWGAPLATAIVDQDLGTPGIQFTDVNGILAAGAVNHYLVTEVTCAESPL